MREPLRAIQELGFTEYEAKAYLALLDESPLSGYGVSQRSGVPRSKVYEVLGGLVRRGAVLVNRGESVQYAPLSPEALISRSRRDMEESIEAARESLENYAKNAGDRGEIWDITGRDAILERAREVAAGARRYILMEIWREDAPELKEVLELSANRGVEIEVIAYGEPEYPFARVHLHDLVNEVTRGLGARWIILSADNREVVTGIVSLGQQSRAAWTTHPGLVVPTTEIVKHDIYVQEMLDRHRDVLEESFGKSLLEIRTRLENLGTTTNRDG